MTWTQRTPPPPAWATGDNDYAFTSEFDGDDFDAGHTADDWTTTTPPPPAWATE